MEDFFKKVFNEEQKNNLNERAKKQKDDKREWFIVWTPN